MKIKDVKLYTVQCHWADDDEPEMMLETVAIGRPDFLDNNSEQSWNSVEEVFDSQVFYYYDNYEQLNQHLKDGDKTKNEFIVTKIIN